MKLKTANIALWVVAFLVLLISCQDPYNPNYKVEHSQPVLIVEGFINTAGNSAFKISKSVLLETETTVNAVSNAKLVIEGENGASYSVISSVNDGEYTFNHAALDTKIRYRLNLTIGPERYISDYATAYLSPPIQKIDTATVQDGVEFYVSTTNEEGQPSYYRWEFDETWKFSAKYHSAFIIDGNEVRYRTSEELINVCYKDGKSSKIVIGNSTGLNKNAISRLPVNLVPNFSEKFEFRYSILLKQYNISKESYTYWSIMKKNSESVGDIFGSMPSEIRGNIKNVNNSDEVVIGWIDAGEPSLKRIYVDASGFSPRRKVINTFYNFCSSPDTIAAYDVIKISQYLPRQLIYEGVYRNPDSAEPTHYVYGRAICADCSERGSLTKPAFWED